MILNINKIQFINTLNFHTLETQTTPHERHNFMSKLLLIRHGQASFGKKNYDQLSDLGMQQATWLGHYLRQCELKPSRIITGSLARHKQTAASICQGLNHECNIEEHLGWNEFDFQAIVQAYLQLHPELTPTTGHPKAFFSLLKKSMTAWSKNILNSTIPETWSDFGGRVNEAMLFSKKETTDGPILVISSGGAISMALKNILRLDNAAMIDLNLQTRNSSVSEIYFNQFHDQLCSFNTIPHLETNDRRHLITYA
jgi:broad specificity phosphatase PhoE